MNTGNERHCVIGPGRLGRSLLAALFSAQCHVTAVGIRGSAATRSSSPLTQPQASPPRLVIGEAALAADLWWLTVPDDAIGEVAATLAAELPAELPADGLTAIHCSGLAPLSSLAPLAERGVRVLSLHPLTSFSRAREPQASDLTGVPCAVTAPDEATSAFGERLASRIGMLPFRLADEHKPAYHLAATVGCNLLVALESIASRLMSEATGVHNGLELLKPLLQATIANLCAASEPAQALSGPVARGDVTTVLAHLATLAAEHPELLAAYRSLSLEALALAAPQLHEERAASLTAALTAASATALAATPAAAPTPKEDSPS